MTPRERLRELINEMRLNSGVGSPLRKTAHELSYSDAIILTRHEFKRLTENQEANIEQLEEELFK